MQASIVTHTTRNWFVSDTLSFPTVECILPPRCFMTRLANGCTIQLAHRYAIFFCSWDDSLVGQLTINLLLARLSYHHHHSLARNTSAKRHRHHHHHLRQCQILRNIIITILRPLIPIDTIPVTKVSNV